jgi:hypothetical protein
MASTTAAAIFRARQELAAQRRPAQDGSTGE